jgi:riboflavin synthase
MFTGLIEETGTIAGIRKENGGAVIIVNCRAILDDLKFGDSVAIDGACQTVTALHKDGFEVEASAETLGLTILNDYKRGQVINLERAMKADGRFGGHIVTGHVEGTGQFIRVEKQGMAGVMHFRAPENIMKYVVYKGSIAVNGVSLTIAHLAGNGFSVAVIPATMAQTSFKSLRAGENVNLEPDIFAKYVEKFADKYDNKTGNITENYLMEHGF